MSATNKETDYERSAEVFGRTFTYQVMPQEVNGLHGWGVRDQYGTLEAWFLSHEHACRWIDLKVRLVEGVAGP